MGHLLFDLTDDDRSLLEAHWVRLGLRSHAETLRALIRGAEPITRPFSAAEERSAMEMFVRASRSSMISMRRIPTPIEYDANNLHLGPVEQKPGSRLKKKK